MPSSNIEDTGPTAPQSSDTLAARPEAETRMELEQEREELENRVEMQAQRIEAMEQTIEELRADAAEVRERKIRAVRHSQSGAKNELRVTQRKQLEELTRRFNLSPDQVAAVQRHFDAELDREDLRTELMIARVSREMTADEFSAAIREIGPTGTRAPIDRILREEILSEDQLVEYEAYEEEKEAERSEVRANSRLASMQRQFNLTEEQKDAIFGMYYTTDFSLTPEERAEVNRQNPGVDNNFVVEYRAQMEKELTAVTEILDEDQFEAFKEYKEEEFRVIAEE